MTLALTIAACGAPEGDDHVENGDPGEPGVTLVTTGGAPEIELDPPSHDFGTLALGCTSEAAFVLRNVGNTDLVVTELVYVSDSEDLALQEAGSFPLTLATGEELEVFVDYAPSDEGADAGYLEVSSNDPSRPTVHAEQAGSGAIHAEVLDVFVQPSEASVDIVFAIDRSSSMDATIELLQADLDVFFAALEGVDTHVAVVTEDDGCVVGGLAWIDGTTSDRDSVFDTMVHGGSGGAHREMGFTLLEAALGSEALAGCNEGLIRDEAALSLVGVTDETEQSANPWSYYVELLQGMKADPHDVVFHAIAGDYPEGCAGHDPGTGWYEATVATGGSFLSVCATEQGSNLATIAAGSTPDLSLFHLSGWPIAETIAVAVDGGPTTSGWTYSSSARTLDFDEPPPAGATVEVAYVVYGDCED